MTAMNLYRFAAIALASLSIVPAMAAEKADKADKMMAHYRPVQAISMVAGSKQVVGYFQQVGSTCQTTLFLADAGDIYGRPTRISMEIGATRTGSIEVDQAKAVLLGCSADADSLTIASVDLPKPMNWGSDEIVTSSIK